MSTDKGESDLDIFNDLKLQGPDGKPLPESKKTLMGLAVPREGLPPVPGSDATADSSRSLPPPPPSRRSGPPPSEPTPSTRTEAEGPGQAPSSQGTPPPPLEGFSGGGSGSSPALDPSKLAPISNATEERPSRLGLDSWATRQPSASRVSAPPPQPASQSAPPVDGGDDLGWDDDDDKTTIYDKDTQTAAQSLLQPSARAPFRPTPSRPSPSSPAGYAGRSTAPPAQGYPGVASTPPRSSMSSFTRILIMVGAAIAFGVAVYWMLPKKANLTVLVTGSNNEPIESVRILVDGKLQCESSPCNIRNLHPGRPYTITATAEGYQEIVEAEQLGSDETGLLELTLHRAGTGIRVFGEGPGLVLKVDGVERGPLPQELRNMEPGEHVIQVSGGPRYEEFQRPVSVTKNVMVPIGPVRLKVIKGLATIHPGEGAEDAEVTLRVGDSRRVLPALPVRLEVETRLPHVLIAKKKGFATFEEPIVFEDGQAEKTITVTLTGRLVDSDRRRSRPKPKPRRAAPAASGKATLSLSSTPPSNVLLDGKPLGSTPLSGIEVEPGRHRVIFINGDNRKPKTIDVAPGSKQSVSVTF